MAIKSKISVKRSRGSGKTDSGLDTETRSLLERRLYLLFTVGFFASLAKYLNDAYVLHEKDDIIYGYRASYLR